MALRTCADCGQPVSEAAKACPGCGRPTDAAKTAKAWVLAVTVGVTAVLGYVLLVNYLA